MVALNRMAAGGKTEVLGALASSPAAISAYVRELKGSREEQVATMSALKHLAALPIARQSIVDAGGLNGLVELATSPSMDQGAKDAAALVLAALAAPPHTELVAASGGAAALIGVVAGTNQPDLTLSAARALEQVRARDRVRVRIRLANPNPNP